MFRAGNRRRLRPTKPLCALNKFSVRTQISPSPKPGTQNWWPRSASIDRAGRSQDSRLEECCNECSTTVAVRLLHRRDGCVGDERTRPAGSITHSNSSGGAVQRGDRIRHALARARRNPLVWATRDVLGSPQVLSPTRCLLGSTPLLAAPGRLLVFTTLLS